MTTLAAPTGNEIQNTLAATYERGADTDITLTDGADFPNSAHVIRISESSTKWCLIIYTTKATHVLTMGGGATDYALANNYVTDGTAVFAIGSTVELVCAADEIAQLFTQQALRAVISGTPVDNQIGIWTGAADIEGDADLTYDGSTKLRMTGGLFIKEQAEATANEAAYGQLWVNTEAPNSLWFTDDADTDKAVLTQSGALTWENRSYEGYEIVDTATEYTIGSGQKFATFTAAAAALKGLILVETITLKLVGNLTESTTAAFNGIISSGGRLAIDLQSNTLTLDAASGDGITFEGPVFAYMFGSGSTLKLGSSRTMDDGVVVQGGARLRFNPGTVDFDNENCDAFLYVDGEQSFLRSITSTWSNNGGTVVAQCRVAYAGSARMDSDPGQIVVDNGGLVINAAGNIITGQGTWNNPDL